MLNNPQIYSSDKSCQKRYINLFLLFWNSSAKVKNIRHFIIRYTVLIIVTTLITRVIPFIVMMKFPMLLNHINPDGSVTTLPLGLAEKALEYVVNILIIILMKKDLDKQNVQSLPILMVTFFHSFIGVIFFLLVILQNKLTTKKQAL